MARDGRIATYEGGRIPRFAAAASLIPLALLLTFLFMEIGCRIYITRVADPGDFLLYASIDQLRAAESGGIPRYSLHRYLGYYPTPGFERGADRHNALGYRGDEIELPKLDGEFRIVCLGGSTTYTNIPKDWRQSYPAQLESILRREGFDRVRVINGGASGWSSWETLIHFQFRVLDLEPDMIIVYQGINDANARLVWPPEAYRGDNSGRRGVPRSAYALPGMLERSSLIRMILIRLGRTRPHADLEQAYDAAPETYLGNEFRLQMLRGIYPTGLFDSVSAAAMFRANRPDYFRRNLENLAVCAIHHGVEVVIASFALSDQFPKLPRAASSEYVGAIAEMNALLGDLANDLDVHFYDFAAEFPDHRELFSDGRHVTPKGAELKAEHFARYLIRNRLLPTPGRVQEGD